MRLANFPVPRDLDSFDFRESVVNETQIRQLYTGEYLTTARNIVFVGGTGTGKTHLSTALARHAIQQGKRTRFFRQVAELIEDDHVLVEEPCGEATGFALTLLGIELIHEVDDAR